MSVASIAKLENRCLLSLAGEDAFAFLQNLVTNDLTLLEKAQAIYSALLTPQGKFLHDFIISKKEDALYLDCPASRKDDLIKRLTMYKLRAKVDIQDVTADFHLYALFGDTAQALATSYHDHQGAQEDKSSLLFADPRLQQLGYRFYCPVTAAQPDFFSSAALVPFDDYTKFRLALGVPEGGSDIEPEKNFLLEINFEELNGVSFSKGCYVGQELTARTKHRAKIRKRLFQFTSDENISVGDVFKVDGKEAATVLSFTAPFGLALTRLDAWEKIEQGAPVSPENIAISKPAYVHLPEHSE
ncbi:CAF17-like 4Fe-4S cluster assembly/insertion protein YgfZ [Sneathiella aquimaris]|uniref:CAF17-like 4Fe-4S cluster assembly/insertion protein YgfZ n=1 Tax=Sneathiella aquimaris TaxID=2599305 RepID=UPI00146CA30F|nr:folate-binding protein YgfZ [Sneathiella aquimaris]